ncbi:hypothetical protein PP899_gp30 [Agrobacterium phage Atu_ph08]|uniref:Uncharacterized protein n=1 Tax=Agrobacterium phage Atu_ph08 TaxID=2024265 RepID=A0A2L0V126_9CAUD|nr:hypothetical protein PP899_gp30 [Agrobacterium phage Atu_ph08]AUZ95466.1 hypothetical protein [Agrobacterium phage Atu_ph08]
MPALTATVTAAVGAARRTRDTELVTVAIEAATARLRAVKRLAPDTAAIAEQRAAMRRVRESVGAIVVGAVPGRETRKLPSLIVKAFTSAPLVVPRLSITSPQC